MEIKVSIPGLEKLVEVVAQGIGGLARPWMMKRIARAQVETQKILASGQAQLDREHELLAASEEQEVLLLGPGEVEIDLDDLETRVARRTAYREGRRQLNLEAVVLGAADALGDEAAISSEPVDEDWVVRFFQAAQEVSNRELQSLWSRLLAREVASPGRVPTRTIEVLRNLASQEARLFSSMRAYLCVTTSRPFLPPAPYVLANVATLTECGLVGSELRWTSNGPNDPFFWRHGGVDIRFAAHKDMSVMGFGMIASAFPLTAAGEHLAAVAGMPTEPCRALLLALRDQLHEHLQLDVLRGDAETKIDAFLDELAS